MIKQSFCSDRKSKSRFLTLSRLGFRGDILVRKILLIKEHLFLRNEKYLFCVRQLRLDLYEKMKLLELKILERFRSSFEL